MWRKNQGGDVDEVDAGPADGTVKAEDGDVDAAVNSVDEETLEDGELKDGMGRVVRRAKCCGCGGEPVVQ
jgi:hypothetical protein